MCLRPVFYKKLKFSRNEGDYEYQEGKLFLGVMALYAGSALGVTVTYPYSGAPETFVVPAGVTSVTIEAWGAQGV